ncbi:MAG: ATPase central domain protein [Alphaproteobacteria bacterium]|nr:ATPase central domain protein [Alphaproteobacteria bacterium]
MQTRISSVEAAAAGLPVGRIETSAGWRDLVLPKDSLRRVDEIRTAAHGEAQGQAALFRGPSGAGKTFAAALLGNALGRPVWAVDLAAIVGKFIGETEKALDRLFAAAEAAGAVLIFDEAEALFARRTEVRDAHDRFANADAAYLLRRVESYAGLTIFASNRRQDLDPAFLRRLRFVVDFPHRRRPPS